jgi:hypothetical protein
MKNFLALTLVAFALAFSAAPCARAQSRTALQTATTYTVAPATALVTGDNYVLPYFNVASSFGDGLLILNVTGTTSCTFTLLQSSTTNSFTVVPAVDAVGLSGTSVVVVSTSPGVQTVPVHLQATSQYLELSATTTGTGNVFGAELVGWKQNH